MVSAAGELGTWRFAGRLELGTAGVLRPGPWLAPRALGWLLLLAVAVEGPALAPALVSAILHHGVALTPMLVAGLLAASGGGYALLVRLGERRAPRELAPASAPVQLTCGALAGAALMGLIYAVLLGTGLYRVRPGHTPDWPVQVLYGFATAFLEELLFRAVALRLLVRLCGAPAGLALSALLFGAAHLFTPHATLFAAAAIAVEAGLLLGACLLLTGRLWLAVGLHAGWNFTQGPVLGAVVSGHVRPDTLLVSGPTPGASTLWSGGTFGPEARRSPWRSAFSPSPPWRPCSCDAHGGRAEPMAGGVEGGAGPVASILLLGWLRAYAAGRGLPEPVPNHGGLALGHRAAHETRAMCTPRRARA